MDAVETKRDDVVDRFKTIEAEIASLREGSVNKEVRLVCGDAG